MKDENNRIERKTWKNKKKETKERKRKRIRERGRQREGGESVRNQRESGREKDSVN